ncbi:unnamed protein product [Musa acuminata subsp. burmannicoides]
MQASGPSIEDLTEENSDRSRTFWIAGGKTILLMSQKSASASTMIYKSYKSATKIACFGCHRLLSGSYY